MKLLFIDESEKARDRSLSEKIRDEKFFVLCGLIINADSIICIENEVKELKDKYGLTNLKDLRSMNKNDKRKSEILEGISTILDESKSRILSTILGSDALRDYKKAIDNHFGAFTFMCERFHFVLLKNKEKGIIHDSLGSLEKDLRDKIHDFITTEPHRYISYNGIEDLGRYRDDIYPSILFTEDEYSEIIQIADLISNSLRNATKKFLQEKKSLPNKDDIEQLYNYNYILKRYWSFFDKSREGKVNGWGIKVWY